MRAEEEEGKLREEEEEEKVKEEVSKCKLLTQLLRTVTGKWFSFPPRGSGRNMKYFTELSGRDRKYYYTNPLSAQFSVAVKLYLATTTCVFLTVYIYYAKYIFVDTFAKFEGNSDIVW